MTRRPCELSKFVPEPYDSFESYFIELTTTKKPGLKNIVHSDFLALFGLKPGTIAVKVKPKKSTVDLCFRGKSKTTS